MPLVTGGFRAYRSAQHRPSARVVATFPFLARGSLRKFSLGRASVSFRRVETSFCEVRDEENRLQEEGRWSCNPLGRESRDTSWNLRGGVVRLLLIRLDYLRATAPALTLSASIIIPSKCGVQSGQPLITRGLIDSIDPDQM